jgi:hypothetical protein
MSAAVATLNILIGLVYTSYGVITIYELRRGWSTDGPSHFGMAWVAMAFTCGPHHLAHGVHGGLIGKAGGLELVALIVGAPAGITWFLLRIEALRGGRGDRLINGTPTWLRLGAPVAAAYGLLCVVVTVWLVAAEAHFGPRYVPNLLLIWLYMVIGYYLLRTQLASYAAGAPWSLSGLSLTAVFPTCALMHAAYLLYAVHGSYGIDSGTLAIDWLAVPAAAYFLWVVRSLYHGTLPDWNRSRQFRAARSTAA